MQTKLYTCTQCGKDSPNRNCNECTETITYSELARRVGDMVMFNNLPEVAEDWFEDMTNYSPTSEDDQGNIVIDDENGDYPEIYQWFAISSGGYDYLERNTNEIIGYSEKLNLHFWCITHFGTPWNGVHVTIKK